MRRVAVLRLIPGHPRSGIIAFPNEGEISVVRVNSRADVLELPVDDQIGSAEIGQFMREYLPLLIHIDATC